MTRVALWMSSAGPAVPGEWHDELLALGWQLRPVAWGAWHEPIAALALVHDTAAELQALQDAPAWVEVVHRLPPAVVLAARLARARQAVDRAEAAHRDALTGLWGRQALAGRLAGWQHERNGQGVQALVLLDVDRMKLVNDAFGFARGDELLRRIGSLLGGWCTERDLAFRHGGEAFVLLLSRTDDVVMRHEIDALLEAVRRLEVPGIDVPVSASAGATWLRPDDSVEAAMARADALLVRAKSSGRNVAVIDDSSRPDRVDPEAELRRFMDVTQVYSERLTQMVHTLGRRMMQGARREALEDRLTGVANRRYFDERLAREFDHARQRGRPLTLLFLDLDDFGAVNRQHGWNFGDTVLQRFVQLAAAGIRLTDWLARWGGEEFCVVMPDTPLAEAAEVAGRLRQGVAGATLETPDGQRLRLTCSVGVAAVRLDGDDDPDALSARAAAAARLAKGAGKNRVAIDGD